MSHLRPLTVLAATAALAWSALAAPPVCSGTVRNAKGKPVEGAKVTVPGAGTAVTAADGTWRIAGAPAGDVLAVAEKSGLFRVRRTVHAEPGKDLVWDATLAKRGVIQGRLVDEYDHPLTVRGTGFRARWRVYALPQPEWMRSYRAHDWGWPPEGGWKSIDYAVTSEDEADDDGRFTIPVDPSILHRLRVDAPGIWSRVLLTSWMSDGLGEIVLRVPPSRMPHAQVRFKLVAPDGTPLSKADVGLIHPEGDPSVFAKFNAVSGSWSSEPVAPGTYTVTVRVNEPPRGVHEFGPVEVADAADVDMGTLRMQPTGHVTLTAIGNGPEASLYILRDDVRRDWWSWAAYSRLGGTNPTAEFDLSPGRHRARVMLPRECEIEQVEVVFDVRSGETTTATIPFRAAPCRAVRFRCPAPVPAHILATVTDEGGLVVARQRGIGETDVALRLPPGKYTAVVETNDERRLTGTLDVPAEDAPPWFLVLVR